MLLIISTLSLTVAGDELQGLIPVKPGYFLSENVVQKMIELYPELEQIFENALQVEAGYFLSGEGVVGLANFIKDLEDENARLQAMVDRLNNSLKEEREAVKALLNEKDNIIVLQREQIEDYKELYQNKDPDIFEKVGWVAGGAGIAALIILLSNM
jgi:predicted nuclease with TOPRIM domain